MNSELKPCPFCGGEAEMQCELEIYCVMCTECNAHGTTVDNWHEGDEAYSEAIAAWNRREKDEEEQRSKIEQKLIKKIFEEEIVMLDEPCCEDDGSCILRNVKEDLE